MLVSASAGSGGVEAGADGCAKDAAEKSILKCEQ
jgi:hypothetical protein